MTLPITQSLGSHLVFYFGLFAERFSNADEGPPKACLSDKRQNIST